MAVDIPTPDERSEVKWLKELERRAYAAMAGAPGLSWSEVKALISERLRERK